MNEKLLKELIESGLDFLSKIENLNLDSEKFEPNKDDQVISSRNTGIGRTLKIVEREDIQKLRKDIAEAIAVKNFQDGAIMMFQIMKLVGGAI